VAALFFLAAFAVLLLEFIIGKDRKAKEEMNGNTQIRQSGKA